MVLHQWTRCTKPLWNKLGHWGLDAPNGHATHGHAAHGHAAHGHAAHGHAAHGHAAHGHAATSLVSETGDYGFGEYPKVSATPQLGKIKHTPPRSSAELFFAEKNGGHRGKISVVDMACLVFIGFLYPPPAWKVFLWCQRSSPKDFLSVVVVYTFFFSAQPLQSEICVEMSVFHTVFGVKFMWNVPIRRPKPWKT